MSNQDIGYVVELWDGGDWKLSENHPNKLYLTNDGKIPLTIMDKTFGILRFNRAEKFHLFMITRPEVFIVYRGMRPSENE